VILLLRQLTPCEKALRHGPKGQRHQLVALVGGMTRMPAVQEKKLNYLRQGTRDDGRQPDEVVAVGAVQGGAFCRRRQRCALAG